MRLDPVNPVTQNEDEANTENRSGVRRLLMWPVLLFFVLLILVLVMLWVTRVAGPANVTPTP